MRQRLSAVEKEIDGLAVSKGRIMWQLQQKALQQQGAIQEGGDGSYMERLQLQLAEVEGHAAKLLAVSYTHLTLPTKRIV